MSMGDKPALQVIIQTTAWMGKDLENEINHLDYLAFGINDDKEEDFKDWCLVTPKEVLTCCKTRRTFSNRVSGFYSRITGWSCRSPASPGLREK